MRSQQGKERDNTCGQLRPELTSANVSAASFERNPIDSTTEVFGLCFIDNDLQIIR